MKKYSVHMAVAGLMLTTTVFAAPFNPKLVAQDASWVMHINMDALKVSTIGKLMLAEEMDADALEQLKQAKEMFGMDPREDLKGVTAYGVGVSEEDVVVVVNGKLDSGKLIAYAKTMQDYQQSRHGSRDVHSWVNAEDAEAQRMYGAFLDAQTGIVSAKLSHLKKALDVADGKQNNVTQGGINTAALSASGAHIAAVADFTNVELSSNPMLAGSGMTAKNMILQIGEATGNVSARLALKQGSVEEAEQMQQGLNGLKMMMMMGMQQENPEGAKVVQSIQINRNAETLSIAMTYPADKLAELIKSSMESDDDDGEL